MSATTAVLVPAISPGGRGTLYLAYCLRAFLETAEATFCAPSMRAEGAVEYRAERERNGRIARQPDKPHQEDKAAPEVVIEAIVYDFRERGNTTLRDRVNKYRISTLSNKQRAELRARLKRRTWENARP